MTAPDYTKLIDTEMWAFIDKVDACYPPGVVDMINEQQRGVYNDMCAVFYQGRPDGVQVRDEDWGGVACRRYEIVEHDVTVIYYHGGGFVVGDLDSHDDVCAEICDRTGYRVISVDYGLAPETVYPKCFNDAWEAFEAISKAYKGPIILAGDSAGGNLAAAVTHYARGRVPDRIKGQVLIYPGLGGDWATESYVRHANAPHLTTDDMKFYMTARTGGGVPPKGDPCYAPLHDTDFSNLPLTVCITAECDPLSSDGNAYRDAIVTAGGQAVWLNEAGLVHGCLRARTMSTRAGAFFDKVTASIDALGQGNWSFSQD